MSGYKKLIAGFGYREGRAYSLDGERRYEESLTELVRRACDNGADEVLIYDRSRTDADHEAAIAAVKEASIAVDAPILTGGRVKRLEDVKKYLYGGASAVFLEADNQEQMDMMKEVSDRFGSGKIYSWLPDASYLQREGEYEALGVSALIINDYLKGRPAGAAVSGLAGSGGLTWLVVSPPFKDTGEASKTLTSAFDCSKVEGAVMTLEETDMNTFMEIKQKLKAESIAVDTFESVVDWKNFKLNSDGLIPVIVQDYKSLEVLMMAYMNEEAFMATLATGRMTYFSRSRNKLWLKGETSGHVQYVKSLRLDCDKDTILASVKQIGAACHTGSRSCFFQTLVRKEYRETNPLKVFEDVFRIILDRKENPREGSYTNYLFDKGIDKILKKLGEEATEIVIAAKNPNPEEIKYEISDFLYHMMVLMADKGITWEEITRELANR